MLKQALTGRTIAAALATIGVVAAAWSVAPSSATADTIERLRSGDDATLRLGYRTDTPPFASEENGAPVGYSVELCKEIGATIARALPDQTVAIEFVPVPANDRFAALERGDIDLLCGATTVTLDRRETMDFSLMTFVTGGVLLVRQTEEPFQLANKIGVLAGTTSESALNRIMALSGDAAGIETVGSHEEGLEKLKSGALNAYFGDRALLIGMMRDNPGAFTLSEDIRTFEPYALPMRRGESELRLMTDRTIARLYRDGGVTQIYRDAFGDARPGSGLVAIYNLMALTDGE